MVPLHDPQLGTEIRETFAEPNWAQWVKLNLEMTKSDGSLLKMQMLRHEDWVLENIDYQFLDEEDLKATSLLTAANSSQFLKSLPLEPPPVPLRTLFAELQDVRLLMAEEEAEAVLVTISLDLPEIGVRGEAVVTGVEPCPVILPGPGKVVLTTFHHASSHLIDLYLSPQPPAGVNSPTTTYLTSTSNSPTHQLTNSILSKHPKKPCCTHRLHVHRTLIRRGNGLASRAIIRSGLTTATTTSPRWTCAWASA